MLKPKNTLLAVDDVPSNIDILLESLGDEYTVRVALDGQSALESVRKFPPDLILLDVMMPGMDGFQVCQSLKKNPAACGIPVIFLTALGDGLDEVRGLELGCVDYITKPFSPGILRSRVRTHLELSEHRTRLESLVRERTAELAEANERLKGFNDARQSYLSAIAHELRTPVNGILGIVDLAIGEIADEELRKEYSFIYSHARQRLMSVIVAAQQLAEIQGDAVSIPTVPVDFAYVLAEAAEGSKNAFAVKNLLFEAPASQPGLVLCQPELLGQSVATLLGVAQKMAAPGTAISACFDESNGHVTLKLSFRCPPLRDDLLRSFFDNFSKARSSSYVEDMGLSVPLAANLVRTMGGTVDLRNGDYGGEILLMLAKAVLERP